MEGSVYKEIYTKTIIQFANAEFSAWKSFYREFRQKFYYIINNPNKVVDDNHSFRAVFGYLLVIFNGIIVILLSSIPTINTF